VAPEPDRTALEPDRTGSVARILLDSALPQLDHLFDYAVPEQLRDSLRAGQRVRVPFRSRTRNTFGYVIDFVEHSDFGGELAQVTDAVSPVPVLTTEVWRLARAVADRAGGSAGDILRLAIPARQVRVEKQHLAGTAVDPGADDRVYVTGDAEAAIADLLVTGERLSLTPSHGPERLDTGEWVGTWAADLARTALAVHALGRSVIIVVPDYRDLDQMRDALAALGHAGIVRVDSRQSNAERYAAFMRALDPVPRIVLGNRSAVYAPAHNLGAILLWTDGDPVLAEPLSPYVHARDSALVRADFEGAGLLFASHARSTEVQRLVDLGYVRAQHTPPKRTRILRSGLVANEDSQPGRIPAIALQLIRQGLELGPVLVQVAAPGYAPIAVCGRCHDLARCRSCTGPIGFRGRGQGACRWCGESAAGWRCEQCGAAKLEVRGAGSGRTAEQFEQALPGARVIISDGEHARSRVDSRPALVVATRGAEPLTAGGYRAVVLLDAERLLGLETLRAGEDCLRWWENAAALAAPDASCVLVGGGGPLVRAFGLGLVEEWLRQELADRQTLRYPPAVRVASVTGGAAEVQRALDRLDGLSGIDKLGPTPYSPPFSPSQTPSPVPSLGATSEESPVVRAIVRFDYQQGPEVAKRLRAALIADAAGASSRTRSRIPGRRPGALRLRFDDRGVFDG
jgi:primosomal protein N' (replication factor Y)